MGTSLRAIMTTAAAVVAASCFLRAESGNWSGMLGAASPQGGAKQWVGTAVGPSIDVMEAYSLGGDDTIRMRFGYFAFKASRDLPQTLTLPGADPTTAKAYPASTTNELFGFSYGAEYVRTLPFRCYALVGLGVTYLTASRTGTFDLTSAGSGPVSSTYSANNFMPYVSAGLGLQITRSLALEGRWQASSMKPQIRSMDLTGGGYTAPAKATFDKRNISSITVGLNLTF